jgi:HSP20 family molecular chaperone IbpA
MPSSFNFFEDSLLDDCKKSPIMNTNIIEKDDGYELQIDLPGVKKDDIKIEMDKGILSISVSINDSKDEENKKYIRKERFTGEIKRSFNISENVDEEDIYASFDNGVLYLNLPKKEEKENKKVIEIN